jgi:hypothetical protein
VELKGTKAKSQNAHSSNDGKMLGGSIDKDDNSSISGVEDQVCAISNEESLTNDALKDLVQCIGTFKFSEKSFQQKLQEQEGLLHSAYEEQKLVNTVKKKLTRLSDQLKP